MLLQVKDITNNLKIESIKQKTFGEVFRKKKHNGVTVVCFSPTVSVIKS